MLLHYIMLNNQSKFHMTCAQSQLDNTYERSIKVSKFHAEDLVLWKVGNLYIYTPTNYFKYTSNGKFSYK